MALDGPIILIEDDKDDQAFSSMCIKSFNLRNKLIIFSNGEEALQYLTTTSDNPFLIICDINMPRMNGLQLRRQINDNEELKKLSTPFVFLTGSASPDEVRKAFDLSVQGFFVKSFDLNELKRILKVIIDYWSISLDPNVRSF